MAIRNVRDAAGVKWEVWEVHPSSAKHGTPEARRPTLAAGLETGWLAFHSADGERRRLVPIPGGWDALRDGEILDLLATAELLPASQRRLIE